MRPRLLRELEAALPGIRVRSMAAAAAAIAVASAWFNQGFFSHDEHFQILEFAWYKLGRTPADALAWEFHERMRPALQPWLAASVFRALDVPRLVTPFFAEFVLRLASGLLGLWVTLELCLHTVPWVREASLKRLLLPGMLFLWFLPYTHGRFASENWGGLVFFGGLCLVLDARAPLRGRNSILRAALAGLLWGAAFYCRFQIGLAIAGAGCWLLLVDRARPRVLAALTASFLIACALNTAIDRWLYGAWVCTPCNYFYMNIVMGKAATFSTEPWWFFLAQMLGLLVPPFSVILVALLAVSLWACRSNVLVWAVVPFLLGHNLLAHKEVRFLIPITYALVPLLVLGADRVPATIRAKVGAWQSRRAARWMFIALNSIALLIMTLKPSSETAIVFRRLYDESQKGPIVLYTDSPLPYLMSGKAVGFYRPENVTVMKVTNLEELRATMRGAPERVFLFQQSLQPPGWSAADGIACTPVARSIPVWAAKFNVNDWTSRLYLWSVFSVRTDATGGGC